MDYHRFIAVVQREIDAPDTATAQEAVRAVLETLSERLMAGTINSVRARLSDDIAKDLHVTRPRESFDADEFLRRVAQHADTDVPTAVRPALERGRKRSGGLARKMSLDEFLTLVADRAGVTADEAHEYAGAVLATVHDAVTEKEFRDLVSELPRSYVELAHA
jgi:uncharacterized protein (DUF2267 family)